ncbi:MAG: hypothetical protein AABX85_02660 [Nanoarchaeota archaeon]
MFWNKKEEKKSLPDLPPIKSPFSKELAVSTENAKMVEEKLDEAEQDFAETHSLPTFPDSPNSSSFSQAAIKEAITQDEIKEPEIDDVSPAETNKKFRAIEMNEDKDAEKGGNPYLTSIKIGSPPSKKVSYTEQTTPYQPKNSFLIGRPPEEEEEEESENNFEKPEKAPEPSKGGDVFVKIEKFYTAKKSLDAIKDQIDQIDELLKKIKDIKIKEERELSVWEKEIALVKSRIQNVNETIFEKLS